MCRTCIRAADQEIHDQQSLDYENFSVQIKQDQSLQSVINNASQTSTPLFLLYPVNNGKVSVNFPATLPVAALVSMVFAHVVRLCEDAPPVVHLRRRSTGAKAGTVSLILTGECYDTKRVLLLVALLTWP